VPYANPSASGPQPQMSLSRNPRPRFSASRAVFLLIDEIVSRLGEADRLPEAIYGRGVFFLRRPIIPPFPAHAPACCSARRRCRPGAVLLSSLMSPAENGGAGRDADERRCAFRAPPCGPGETIEIEVELTERLAEAFFF